MRFGSLRICGLELILNLDGTVDGIHGAGKLSQQVVAYGIHDAAAVLTHQTGNRLVMLFNYLQRLEVVFGDQARVADGIDADDGCQPAFRLNSGMGAFWTARRVLLHCTHHIMLLVQCGKVNRPSRLPG